MIFRPLRQRLRTKIRNRLAQWVLNGPEFQQAVHAAISGLLPLTKDNSQPNINALWTALYDLNAIRMNVKNSGFEIAARLAPLLAQVPVPDVPPHIGLGSKPSTQADIESPWFAYWCRQLKLAPLYHRKLWEYAFVLQGLSEAGVLRAGLKGLGFGCGEEPLPSYFASLGLDVTVTDLPPDSADAQAWRETGQHAAAPEKIWQPQHVDKAGFERHVTHMFVDMNAIPESLAGRYDFCWSICAFEHLGSIEKGLAFVENAMKTLRPGGVALHTTEYNFGPGEETVDNWITVLFRQRHFEALAQRLRVAGHEIAPLDFNVGEAPLDRFVDLPPYYCEVRQDGQPHLKLMIDGFPSTCYGLIVRKKA